MKQVKEIGRYRLIEQIGHGGMAEVFKAEETLDDGSTRIVAIKRLFPRLASDKEFVGMFLNEARIATGMSHPNIVHTYDFVNTGSYYYIIMEYLAGMDLEDLIAISPPGRMTMSLEETSFVVHEIALALGYAHRGGTDPQAGPVVHRDISPGNIMIDCQGRVMVTDFGIARAAQYAHSTRPGVLKGKYEYMAPEYVQGKDFDGRADLFSLGVVFYELLAGENPFMDLLPKDIWDKVLNFDPPSLCKKSNVPDEIDEVVKHALQKDPEKRIPSGEVFASLVKPFFGDIKRSYVSGLLGKRVTAALAQKGHSIAFEYDIESDEYAPHANEQTEELHLDQMLERVEPVNVPRPDFSKMLEYSATRQMTIEEKALWYRDNQIRYLAVSISGVIVGCLLFWLLWPNPKGYLSVMSDLKAVVLINGEFAGNTPVDKISLRTGSYTVEVRRPGSNQVKNYRRNIQDGNVTKLVVRWKTPRKRRRVRKPIRRRRRIIKEANERKTPKKAQTSSKTTKKQTPKRRQTKKTQSKRIP